MNGIRYFRCRRDFCSLPGVTAIRGEGIFWAFPDTDFFPYFMGKKGESGWLDSLLSSSALLKDSEESTAAIVPLPDGRSFFLKRNRYHSIHALRYALVPARVFRAAFAAHLVMKAGVYTPRVLGVAEVRRGGVLQSGYLMTETAEHAEDLMTFVKREEEAFGMSDTILDNIAKVAASLHRCGLYHGNLKLVNLFCLSDEKAAMPGVWDLDSVREFKTPVPEKWVLRELGRIVSSFLITADENHGFPDSFFNLERMSCRLLASYGRYAPDRSLSCEELMKMAWDRWLSKRSLKHSIVEKRT